jgi:hypothetical protein
LKPLNVHDVVSVYQGKAGGCWCCAGERYYNPAFTELIAEYVGERLISQPKPEQFNQGKVAFITEFVDRHIEKQPSEHILYGDDDDYGVTYSLGDGLYILELNGLKYHVRTTADYELNRRIKSELATKETSEANCNE